MKDGSPGGSFIGAKFKETGKTIGRWEGTATATNY